MKLFQSIARESINQLHIIQFLKKINVFVRYNRLDSKEISSSIIQFSIKILIVFMMCIMQKN